MGYNFDGPNKRILITTTTPFSVQDLYSRWKDWAQTSDNSKFLPAFRSVAGDPIGSGQTIAPYFFLNTIDGWRIQPLAVDHELRISGNLYSEDSGLSMFATTASPALVNVIIERSSAALAVQAGSGLSVEQATQLRELHLMQGLDPTKPLVAHASSRKIPADGSEIDQTISQNNGYVTVQRQ